LSSSIDPFLLRCAWRRYQRSMENQSGCALFCGISEGFRLSSHCLSDAMRIEW
jgi:hypothetical protein